MALSLRTFTEIVQTMGATVQGRASRLVNLTPGSVTNAILEASASSALWLQYIAVQVLLAARLSTSAGADADSFVADYGLARLPAVPANGVVTLSRYAATRAVSRGVSVAAMT